MKIKRRIIAHRGATEFRDHENTLEAFQKAIDLQIEAIELDIRKSKDNVLIVHHNPDIDNIFLNTLTYEEMIKLSQTKEYIIPKFEDVLRLSHNQLFLDIELKEPGYETEVIDMIHKYLSYDEYFIRSFDDHIIRKVKKLDSKIKTGLLLGVEKASVIKRLSELFPLFRILRSKCDFVSPHYRLLLLGYIRRMHLIRKPVITWSLNDHNLIKKWWRKKIDGIITDIPVQAIKIINS